MNDVGLLLSRLTIGGGIAAHGAQKAFGAFDGPGPKGAALFLETLGFRPGTRYAQAAAWTELASGAMMALGIGGPLAPAALVSTMLVAQSTVHAKNGFFAQKNGVELGLLYAAGAVALASSGYGRISLDATFGWQKQRTPWVTTLALLGGIAAGYVVLAQRAVPASALVAVPDDHIATIAAGRDGRPVPADFVAARDPAPGVDRSPERGTSV